MEMFSFIPKPKSTEKIQNEYQHTLEFVLRTCLFMLQKVFFFFYLNVAVFSLPRLTADRLGLRPGLKDLPEWTADMQTRHTDPICRHHEKEKRIQIAKRGILLPSRWHSTTLSLILLYYINITCYIYNVFHEQLSVELL